MKTTINTVFNWLRLLALASILVCANSTRAATVTAVGGGYTADWADPPAITYSQPLTTAQYALTNVRDAGGNPVSIISLAYSPSLGTLPSATNNLALMVFAFTSGGATLTFQNSMTVNRLPIAITPSMAAVPPLNQVNNRYYGQTNGIFLYSVVGTTNAQVTTPIASAGTTFTNDGLSAAVDCQVVDNSFSPPRVYTVTRTNNAGTYTMTINLFDNPSKLGIATNYDVTLPSVGLVVQKTPVFIGNVGWTNRYGEPTPTLNVPFSLTVTNNSTNPILDVWLNTANVENVAYISNRVLICVGLVNAGSSAGQAGNWQSTTFPNLPGGTTTLGLEYLTPGSYNAFARLIPGSTTTANAAVPITTNYFISNAIQWQDNGSSSSTKNNNLAFWNGAVQVFTNAATFYATNVVVGYGADVTGVTTGTSLLTGGIIGLVSTLSSTNLVPAPSSGNYVNSLGYTIFNVVNNSGFTNYSFTFTNISLGSSGGTNTVVSNNTTVSLTMSYNPFNDATNILATYSSIGRDAGNYDINPEPVDLAGILRIRYNPIILRSGTLTITQATPGIQWNVSSYLTTYGQLFATNSSFYPFFSGLSNTITSGAPGWVQPNSFLFSPPLGTLVNAGIYAAQALSLSNSPLNRLLQYNSATGTVTYIVQKANQSFIWPAPAPIAYGQPYGPGQLNAQVVLPDPVNMSPPGSISYDFDPGRFTVVGTQVYPYAGTNFVRAIAAGTTNYNGSITNIMIVVATNQVTINAFQTGVLPTPNSVVINGTVFAGNLAATGTVWIALVQTNATGAGPTYPVVISNRFSVVLNPTNGAFSTNINLTVGGYTPANLTNGVVMPVWYEYATSNDPNNVFGRTNEVDVVVGAPSTIFSGILGGNYPYGTGSFALGGQLLQNDLVTVVPGQNVQITVQDNANNIITNYPSLITGADGKFSTNMPYDVTFTVPKSSYKVTYGFNTASPFNPLYKGTTNNVALNIIPRTLIINPISLSRAYGDSNPATWYANLFNVATGDTANSLGANIIVTQSSVDNTAPPGTYPISIAVAWSPSDKQFNYTPTITNAANLTVTNRLLIVVIDDQYRGTNAPNPPFTVHYAGQGFALSDTASLLTPPLSLGTSATLTSPLGDYPITNITSNVTARYYTVVIQNGTLHVTPAYVNWPALASIEYGQKFSSAQFTATVVVWGTNYPATGSYFVDTNNFTPPAWNTSASNYMPYASASFPIKVTFTGIDLGGSIITNMSKTNFIAVTQKTLYLQALNTNTLYGATITPIIFPPNSVNFYTNFGLVQGETITNALNGGGVNFGYVSNVFNQPQNSYPLLTNLTPVGSYLVRLAGQVSSNYLLVPLDGIYTVGKAVPTITWGALPNSVYGAAVTNQSFSGTNFTLVLTASGSGTLLSATDGEMKYYLVTNKTWYNVTNTWAEGANPVSLTANQFLPAGAFDTLEAVFTITNATKAPNYDVARAFNSMVVTQYQIMAQINFRTNAGTGLPDQTIPLTATNFVYGQNVVFSNMTPGIWWTNTANPNSNLVVFVNWKTNMFFTDANGAMSDIQFATTNASDTLNGLGLRLYSTGQSAGNDVGNYLVTVAMSAAASNNFLFSVNGTTFNNQLHIYPANLVVGTLQLFKVYGAPMPDLTLINTVPANIDNIQNHWTGFTSAISTNTPVGTNTFLTAVWNQFYPKLADYNVTYSAGQFGSVIVTGAPLTAAANNKFMRPGQTLPALDATYTGFVNGENASVITTLATWTTTATPTSAFGPYPITLATPAVAQNYIFNYIPGVITVGVNSAPVAAPDSMIRQPGEVGKLAKYKLLSNDYDAEGDVITFVSVANRSANGAQILSDTVWVYYVPVSGSLSNANDSFTYTIRDDFGGSSIGTIFVTVRSASETIIPKNLVGAQVISNNWLMITFAGLPTIPGVMTNQYWLQGSATLINPVWENLVSLISANPVTTDANGNIIFIDTEANNFPNRFYRSTPFRP